MQSGKIWGRVKLTEEDDSGDQEQKARKNEQESGAHDFQVS